MSNNSTSQTNWDRLDAMKDKEIDLSDCPNITTEQFAQGILRRGLKPKSNKE